MIFVAVYRVNKNRGYTVMANFHLRDKSLSLKAVGLLSKMLSFNDGWKFSTKGLSTICKEGPDAILSALRELEKHGYLVRHRQRDGKGRMSSTIFEIYEEPQESTPEREMPHTENPCVEKPDVDNPRGDKSAQINTDQVITQERNCSLNNSTAKAKPKMTVKNGVIYGDALSAQEKKRIVMQKKKDRKAKKVRKSAQQTIPYVEMCRDGICKVNSRLYTKSIAFEDINYQLAQNEDKTAIFENWCDFLNYFDSSIFVQLSFINQKASLNEFRKRINIPAQEDAFNDIRSEYSGMLQSQLTKGNNGLVKKKYITFGIEADSLRTAKPKLERIETDILNNFKTLGVRTEPLSGYERLKVLHDVLNMDTNEPFRFSFDMVARTGLSTKDFIAPTSFDFREGKCFKMGKTIGAVSFLQILAPELNDRMSWARQSCFLRRRLIWRCVGLQKRR